jgi:hypothetical protein
MTMKIQTLEIRTQLGNYVIDYKSDRDVYSLMFASNSCPTCFSRDTYQELIQFIDLYESGLIARMAEEA